MRIIKCCVVFAAAFTAVCDASLAIAGPTYTFNTLATFNGTNGELPEAGLLADTSGNLYGETLYGGTNNNGTVFEYVASTQTLNTLATFSKFTTGASPGGAAGSILLADTSGNLYGTTGGGGTYGSGTIFEVAASTDALTALASFDAVVPGATLASDASGNLYGTLQGGGPTASGTVFEYVASTHTLTTVATFNGTTNGLYPLSGVISDTSGNLYGTTYQGGSSNDGIVFEVAAGTHALSTLATFNGSNGVGPMGGLVSDASGDLYGTTRGSGQGITTSGTVFEVAAGTHTLTTLATFSGTGQEANGSLIIDASGNLFGTTAAGGTYNDGTVFEVAAGTHTLTTLFSFNGTDGANPECGLSLDGSGNLYGTTVDGGVNNDGTVFELSPVTKFTWTNSASNGSWSSPSNWTPASGPPNFSGATAIFANTSPTGIVTLDGNQTVGAMQFNNGASGSGMTISAGNPAGTLTLDNTGYGTTASIGVTAGQHTISAPVVLNQPVNISITTTNSGTGLTISGPISDGGNGNGLTLSGGGALTLTGANTYTGPTTINSGTLQLGSGGATGSLSTSSAITDNGTLVFNRSNSVTQGTDFAKVISGNGGVTQLGSGTLILSGANTYAGTTTVIDGRLSVTGSLANNGSAFILVAPSSAGYPAGSPLIQRVVATGAGYAGLGSQIDGDLNTKADILSGTNTIGSGTVNMQWRLPNANETSPILGGSPASPPLPSTHSPLISDVLNLTGMSNSADEPAPSDPFVLQMTYDPALLKNELAQAADGSIYLAWLNPTAGVGGVPLWQNAILGDTGNDATFAEQGFLGSFATFQSEINDTNIADYIGAWGVDTANHDVWAVTDHNSEFAVVPEPSTLLLACMAAVGLIFVASQRRGQKMRRCAHAQRR